MKINCPRCDSVIDLGEYPHGLFSCDNCQIVLRVWDHCMKLDVPVVGTSTRKLEDYIIKELGIERKVEELRDKCYKDYDHFPIYLILSKENYDELQMELGYEKGMIPYGVHKGMKIAIALEVNKNFMVVV